MPEDEDRIDWSTAPEQLRAAHKEQAEELKALRERDAANAARLAVIDRREAFEKVKAEAGDAAKDVSLEDLGEMPLEQITATALRVKQTEKAEARAAAEAQMAKDMGFESVEALQAFRTEAEASKAQRLAAMATTAAAAVGGQGSVETPETADDVFAKAFNDNSRLPHDERVAAALNASFAKQAEDAKQGARV